MTWQVWVVLCLIFLMCGIGIGFLLHYGYGEPKCRHRWKEIARKHRATKSIVVHLCDDCGRRKFTRY